MADQLFTTEDIDQSGRSLVLSDQIQYVFYYDSSLESWDKSGSAGQSWYREKYLPNDAFDTEEFLPDRWTVIDTPEVSESTLNQDGGVANFGVEKDEGTVGLSSAGKWTLAGDFELRLYIDWASYYNEYRSITHSFLKIGKDDENCARITFCFNGSGYQFSSEKSVGRSLTFFDWQENGEPLLVDDIGEAEDYAFLKITRTSGVVKTFVSNGSTDTQVGEDLSDDVFAADLFVEIGVETKEYNTYRQSFTKFFVIGETSEVIEFFSPNRGDEQAFPDRAILVVDDEALSVINADNKTLWMRFIIGGDSSILDPDVRVKASNGAFYLTSSTGLLVFDFHRDSIFKYSGSLIQVSLDPITLRNSSQIYKTHTSNVGTMVSNNVLDIACKNIGGTDYVCMATDLGLSVKRVLASGVYNNTEGELPLNRVEISDLGAAYWSGYDSVSNQGSLSYYSNITTLTAPGTNTFSRTGVYTTSGLVKFFGEAIQTFDVRTRNGTDLIAVGTSEGVSFLSFSPGSSFTGSVSYGVDSVSENPILDPSFEEYLGINWKTSYNGFHKKFFATRETSFVSAGSYSLRMKFEDLETGSFYSAGTYGSVYQDVDFTGVNTLYFDIKIVCISTTSVWKFQILVGDTVVKEYLDTDGSFTKLTDSVDVSSFTGAKKLSFRLYIPNQRETSDISERELYIDNLRTSIGVPDYGVLPARNSSIREVLLQYDEAGHKIYFAAQNGYGAIDLDDNSLDYFTSIEDRVPDSDILSADFSRIEDED